MKISVLVLCSALAALSAAEAIPAPRATDLKPKYYFPRAVKRQVFTNTTATSTSDQTGGTSGLVDSIVATVADPSSILPSTNAQNTDTGTGPVQAPSTTDTTAPSASEAPAVGNSATTPASPTITPAPASTPESNAVTIGLSTIISGSSATDAAVSAADALSSVQSVANSLVSAGATATGSDFASITNALTSVASAAESANSALSSAQQPVTTPTDVIATPTDGATPLSTPPSNPSSTPPLNPSSTPPSTPPSDPSSTQPSGPQTNSQSGPPSNTNSPTASLTVDSGTFSPTASQPSNSFSGTGNVSPTFAPSDSASQTPDVTPTVAPSVTPDITSNTFVPPLVANQTSDDANPTFAPSRASVPESIKPTGSDSATALIPQSSILSAASKTETPISSTSSPSSIPTSLPGVIKPDGGIPDVPDNSTLIQLGFTYGLNYNFVVSSTTAVAQIFSYLPAGVSYGLDINKKEVVMQYLQPYNTLASLQYITTLAMAYIPSDQVDKLSMALLNPSSDLYNNPNPSVRTLMAMVDPSIPLLAGTTMAGGTPVNSANAAATSTGAAQGDAPGSDTGSSSPVRPSSVGIAVGAVAGAAVYGAAMFLVARRYKKRKASHQRSSSTVSGGARRPGEASTLMTGARNSYGSRYPQQQQNGRGSRNSDRSDGTSRSGRTYISPPVMAENSLGWN